MDYWSQKKNDKTKNEITIKILHNELNHLKSAFEAPRMYLAEYFDEFKNKVDIECEIFSKAIISQDGDQKASEVLNQARLDQSVIVEEIKFHEQACLENMPTNEFESTFRQQFENMIRSLEVKFENKADSSPWGLQEMWQMRYK